MAKNRKEKDYEVKHVYFTTIVSCVQIGNAKIMEVKILTKKEKIKQDESEEVLVIRKIPMTEIDPFADNPYAVRDDEDMFQLMDSIQSRGVVVPAVVRQKDDGKYELLSGHRRKRASELLGFDTLRCQVVEMDDDEATIFLVESNYHRSKLLPSEKAKAYKMHMEAMKRKAGRPRKNFVPLEQNNSREELAKMIGESESQIQRYIRLTYLVPELLEMVDQDRMKMRPAVEISYLPEDSQRDLVDEIDMNEVIPSHAQAIRMRKLSEEGKLTPDIISLIINERKPNQEEKIVFKSERIRKLIPAEISHAETEEYVFNALKFYRKYLRNREERER